MKTILSIIKKEFAQFKRDPRMFAIILIAPVVQLIFLGYAATFDLKIIRMGFFDSDHSVESRRLIEKFSASNIFTIDYHLESYDEIDQIMQSGGIMMALVIPRGYEKDIRTRNSAPLQILVNGSDGNSANIAAGYVSLLLTEFNKKLADEIRFQMGRTDPPVGTIVPEQRVWFNPLLLTRYYMVPGIVGLLLSIITLILTSLAIVKEKEIGTYEQLIVTPIKPYQLILGKLIPFAILAFIAVFIVLAAMRIVFDIPVKGSLPFLLLSSLFYILSTLGMGLFVSTVSKTQQQAMMIAIFALMLPMVYLSGFAFPLENAPFLIQLISYFIPLRYFITIIRSVILQGNGFSELWIEGTILLAMGAAILYVSSLKFKKELD